MFNRSPGQITILTSFDRISLFHTLKPVLFHQPFRRGAFRFKLLDSVEKCLGRDYNRSLLVMRLPKVPDVRSIEIMRALRAKYRRLVFFNDGAAAGTNNFEFLPFVDRFIVKSMFRDRSQYLLPLYRRRLFTDYYHRKLGVTDPDIEDSGMEKQRDPAASGGGRGADDILTDWAEVPAAVPLVDPEDLDKLRLGWNIGVGDFPREDLRQRAGVFTARAFHPKISRLFFRPGMPEFIEPGAAGEGDAVVMRDIPVHARLGKLPAPSVNRQREIFLEIADGDPRFVTGRAPKKQYDEEMRRAAMTLSPFGWGEVCFRDFEAIFAGTLILKPDMRHIDTWPDIYRPGETYVPLSWDGEDLFEKVEYYLSHPRERAEITRNAQQVYREAIEELPARFISIMEEAFG